MKQHKERKHAENFYFKTEIPLMLKEELIGGFFLRWEPIDIDTENCGFRFIVYEEVVLTPEQNYIEYVVKGVCFFDGIRHLWLRQNKDLELWGYDNYPNISDYIEVFKRLKELEQLYGKSRTA